MRADMVFERSRRKNGAWKWKVTYKRGSMICGDAICPYGKPTPLVPPVFVEETLNKKGMEPFHASSSSVRISYHMALETTGIARIVDALPRMPDILYMNVGAWDFPCDAEAVRDSLLRKGWNATAKVVVWGTKQAMKPSPCDGEVARAFSSSKLVTLNRAVLPASALGRRNHLGGVHYSHLVNSIEFNRLFNKVLPASSGRGTQTCAFFDDLCSETGSKIKDIEARHPGLVVPQPEQGWKANWKFSCTYRVP